MKKPFVSICGKSHEIIEKTSNSHFVLNFEVVDSTKSLNTISVSLCRIYSILMIL